MKNSIDYLFVMIFGMCALLGISYLSWSVGRKINYRFSYKSMVQEEIRSMVKKDALK